MGLTCGLGTSGEMTTQGVTWSTSPLNQYFGIGGQLKYWSLDSSFGSKYSWRFYLVATLKKYYHFYLTPTITLVLQFGGMQLHGSELMQATLLSHGRQQKRAVFLCHLSSHYHIYIVKQVETISFKSGSDQCPVIYEVFTYDFRPWLKKTKKRRLLKLASNDQQKMPTSDA